MLEIRSPCTPPGRSIDDRASKHGRRRENPWLSITTSRISKGHPVDPQVHPSWSAENPIGRRCQNPIAFAYNRPLSGCRPSNLHGASLLSSQWRVDDRETEPSFCPSGGKDRKRHPRSIREQRVASFFFFLFLFAWTFFFFSFFPTDPSIRSTNWRSKVDPRNDVKSERVLHS